MRRWFFCRWSLCALAYLGRSEERSLIGRSIRCCKLSGRILNIGDPQKEARIDHAVRSRVRCGHKEAASPCNSRQSRQS